MAEITTRDGSWTFDGEILRIVPGHDRSVHKLRRAMGEIAVPLRAVAGVAFEPGRKGGRLRLRLRPGADPFTQAVGGGLPPEADPYRLAVGRDRVGVAEFLVDDVRNSLIVWEVPDGPCDRYLMPGPPVPISATAGDGTATFDGARIRLEWNWMAEEAKTKAGPREFALGDVAGVEWSRQSGMGYGFLRFRLRGASAQHAAENDPNGLAWGIQREGGTTALLAAAVVARLPHPFAPAEEKPSLEKPAPETPALAAAAGAADPDVLLRRLRELGELHRDGVLTDEEFATAKTAMLDRFRTG
ncbi:DUF4429 domain-containing protein [Actinomadura kijaniata]|uniref:DUF4429 domain-containing protein n=1 Tax=Actinomadura kijaniata TaxID=46161 RepID=UPI00082F84AE|nr:DUF4429 domain-containing protein [Actinomadura kijaniata]